MPSLSPSNPFHRLSLIGGTEAVAGVPVGFNAPDDLEVYTLLDDVPVDDVPDDSEGYDSDLVDAPWANPAAAGMPAAGKDQKLTAVRFTPAETKRRLIVPHPRDLRRGQHGPDVKALQRALAHAKLRPWRPGQFTGIYGKGVYDQIKIFQRRHKLRVDGVYGRVTHKAMARHYDAYGITLIRRWHPPRPKPSPVEARREALVAAAMIAYNYRWRIHYTQGPARMWLVRHHVHAQRIPLAGDIYEDCSSLATWTHWNVGVNDPNGLGYNGFGYTGTLAVHGVRIDSRHAPVGALDFYGRGFPYSHVAIRISAGRVISHGSEIGPVIVSPFYRSDHQQTRQYAGL